MNDPGDRVGNQYAIYNCDYPIGSGVCANIARVGTTRREPASGVSSTWRERSGSGTWTGTTTMCPGAATLTRARTAHISLRRRTRPRGRRVQRPRVVLGVDLSPREPAGESRLQRRRPVRQGLRDSNGVLRQCGGVNVPLVHFTASAPGSTVTEKAPRGSKPSHGISPPKARIVRTPSSGANLTRRGTRFAQAVRA